MKLAIAILACTACTRPSEQRAETELAVGQATSGDADVIVAGGLAAVRDLGNHRLELWAEAPVLDVSLAPTDAATGTWRVVVRNAMPDAVLAVDGAPPIARLALGDRPTVAQFDVALATAGPHALRLAPPDADRLEPFRVAAMADIQTALPVVDDIFRAIDAVPDARFVVGMGDLTQRARDDEYDLFEAKLDTLDIPFYTTLGNHELWSDPQHYMARFGRPSFSYDFKGATFTYVDSGDEGLDPLVEDWLVGWLARARDRVSIFATHVPPIDPVGIRDGAFRSADDGHRLIERLVEGGVDLALYGHIHTYTAFDHGGIRAFISGGGGALPERWDGIDRHFLMIAIDPVANTVGTVEVHRVADR